MAQPQALPSKFDTCAAPHHAPFAKLLTDAFIARYSRFETTQELLHASQLGLQDPNDILFVPVVEWDRFISQNTDFSSWRVMLSKAIHRYVTATS